MTFLEFELDLAQRVADSGSIEEAWRSLERAVRIECRNQRDSLNLSGALRAARVHAERIRPQLSILDEETT